MYLFKKILENYNNVYEEKLNNYLNGHNYGCV